MWNFLVWTDDIHHVSQPNFSVPSSVKPLFPTENCKCCTIVLLEVTHRLTRAIPYFPNAMRFHSILEGVRLFIYVHTKSMAFPVYISTKHIHFALRYLATISQFFWAYPLPIFFQIGCRIKAFVLFTPLNKLRFL